MAKAKAPSKGCCDPNLCTATAAVCDACAASCGNCPDDPCCVECATACKAAAEAARKCAGNCATA